MQKKLATTKTILIAILLVILASCLTITLVLTCQQNVAQAEQPVIFADNLSSEDSSGNYPFMTVAEVTVSDEEELRKQFDEATTGTVIKLGTDISIIQASTISLTRDVELTLDLNGKTILGNGRSRVFYISGNSATLNLIDSSGNDSGKITGGNGGMYMAQGGTLNMYGGTISGNISEYGAGANMDASFFNMYGGVISNNTANYTGGGVYVKENSMFVMTGGTISQNFATNADGNGGGGVLVNAASFNMQGGTISHNLSPKGGGVTLIAGELTMSGTATISGNNATQYGGGVWVNVSSSTLTMNGGTISYNKASYGGGVYNVGTFTMSGGEIEFNAASSSGGGVYSSVGSKFEMSGEAYHTTRRLTVVAYLLMACSQ